MCLPVLLFIFFKDVYLRIMTVKPVHTACLYPWCTRALNNTLQSRHTQCVLMIVVLFDLKTTTVIKARV
jgi:hypothetical protein